MLVIKRRMKGKKNTPGHFQRQGGGEVGQGSGKPILKKVVIIIKRK